MYYYYTSMTNCTVSWADGPAPFDMLGLNPVVKNNAFLWSGYALGEVASLGDRGNSKGLVFTHNTVGHFNAFAGLTPGLTSVIAANEFYGTRPPISTAPATILADLK